MISSTILYAYYLLLNLWNTVQKKDHAIKPVGIKISTLFNIQLNVVTREITAYETLSEKD